LQYVLGTGDLERCQATCANDDRCAYVNHGKSSQYAEAAPTAAILAMTKQPCRLIDTCGLAR
jgi:hypothetical protein